MPQVAGDSAGVADARSPAHEQLGATIREVRTDQGLTLEELAHRISGTVSVRYLAGTERGEANITFATLLRICAALDIELLDLIAKYSDREARHGHATGGT